MKPASQTYLYFLEEQGILFHEPLQKLYHLNTIATFIWCMLDEGRQGIELRGKVSETFDISLDKATRFIGQAETLFQSLGVIQGFELELPESDCEEKEQLETEKYSDDIFVHESRYSLLNSTIKMRFSNTCQYDWVNPVLQHLSNYRSDHVTTVIDIVEQANGKKMLYRDQRPVLSCEKYDQLAPKAKSLVWQTAVNAHNFFLDIHAGVVGNGKCCFLMPAASGGGKSTLTTALVHAGFEYFSDEVALLSEGDLWVEVFPMATCIKDSGVEIMSRYYPHLGEHKLHYRGDGKRVRYVAPSVNAIPQPGTRRPVGAIVFPLYAPGIDTSLKLMSKIEAMKQLEKECLLIGTKLTRSKVSEFLQWIDKTPCYQLITTDLDKTVTLFQDIIE